MNDKYLTQRVAKIRSFGGYVLGVTFRDGFYAQIDLSSLLDEGPIFDPWRDEAAFAQVWLDEVGVPRWGGDMDLSPDSLRAWCEAGRVLTPDETDHWIAAHSRDAEQVA